LAGRYFGRTVICPDTESVSICLPAR